MCSTVTCCFQKTTLHASCVSAALTGALLTKVIQTELAVPLTHITLWSDSTTVLHWIKSESCRYKVFVGTQVTEIQNLTNSAQWRYVDSRSNPADDITHGLTLEEMTHPHRWNRGPDFLYLPADQWSTMPSSETEPQLPDASKFPTWKQLFQETARSLHGTANQGTSTPCKAADYLLAEKLLLQKSQEDSFPEELKALNLGRPLPSDSRLASLSPEHDEATGLLRVGGRLRHAETLELDMIHPVILDPSHNVTRLLIQDMDESLMYPRPERALAELRRRFWILRGREAVRKHQH